MKRNKREWPSLLAWPLFLEQSIDELDADSKRPLVGGQAVLDGVMMRNGDHYGLAVRRKDGSIVACRRPWKKILNLPFLRIPFLRGFPVLLETLCNGIKALNTSAILSEEKENAISKPQLLISLLFAFAIAFGLFVVAPHLLSFLMYSFHLGGDVEGLSFHLWDGFFKTAIFLGYIWLISLLPEIQEVLKYHGAEHKTIHAFEKEDTVTAEKAEHMSRLHPRCGTTFLLFVITMSILVHAFLVPVILQCITVEDELTKHLMTLAVKLFLLIPISACAYELIRGAAKLKKGLCALLLQSPGLFLQKLSTKEPGLAHLEVAVVALYEALDHEDRQEVRTCSYQITD